MAVSPVAAIAAYHPVQHAQPVLFAHHILAYAWMFERDKGRFRERDRERRDVHGARQARPGRGHLVLWLLGGWL